MRIHVNEKELEVVENITIATLLKERELNELGGLAVALNAAIIPKNDWENTSIHAEDKLTIITATAGG